MSMIDFLVCFSDGVKENVVDMPLDKFYDEYVCYSNGKVEQEYYSNVSFGRAITPFEKDGFLKRRKSGNKRYIRVFSSYILETFNPLRKFFKWLSAMIFYKNEFLLEEAYEEYKKYCTKTPILSLEEFEKQVLICERYKNVKLKRKTYIYV